MCIHSRTDSNVKQLLQAFSRIEDMTKIQLLDRARTIIKDQIVTEEMIEDSLSLVG